MSHSHSNYDLYVTVSPKFAIESKFHIKQLLVSGKCLYSSTKAKDMPAYLVLF